ncbi:MAG: hypothetical protein KBC68_01260 [Candidatus Pacebacteria bacterium]|nr:hypothetical protein [Candidatus Paceibacterota bacterium]
MKKLLQENWFKILILALGLYAITVTPFKYADRALWAEERLTAFNKCVEDFSIEGAIDKYSAYQSMFRACKNMSDEF